MFKIVLPNPRQVGLALFAPLTVEVWYNSVSLLYIFCYLIFRFPNIFAPPRPIISEGNWESDSHSDVHSGPPVPLQT